MIKSNYDNYYASLQSHATSLELDTAEKNKISQEALKIFEEYQQELSQDTESLDKEILSLNDQKSLHQIIDKCKLLDSSDSRITQLLNGTWKAVFTNNNLNEENELDLKFIKTHSKIQYYSILTKLLTEKECYDNWLLIPKKEKKLINVIMANFISRTNKTKEEIEKNLYETINTYAFCIKLGINEGHGQTLLLKIAGLQTKLSSDNIISYIQRLISIIERDNVQEKVKVGEIGFNALWNFLKSEEKDITPYIEVLEKISGDKELLSKFDVSMFLQGDSEAFSLLGCYVFSRNATLDFIKWYNEGHVKSFMNFNYLQAYLRTNKNEPQYVGVYLNLCSKGISQPMIHQFFDQLCLNQVSPQMLKSISTFFNWLNDNVVMKKHLEDSLIKTINLILKYKEFPFLVNMIDVPKNYFPMVFDLLNNKVSDWINNSVHSSTSIDYPTFDTMEKILAGSPYDFKKLKEIFEDNKSGVEIMKKNLSFIEEQAPKLYDHCLKTLENLSLQGVKAHTLDQILGSLPKSYLKTFIKLFEMTDDISTLEQVFTFIDRFPSQKSFGEYIDQLELLSIAPFVDKQITTEKLRKLTESMLILADQLPDTFPLLDSFLFKNFKHAAILADLYHKVGSEVLNRILNASNNDYSWILLVHNEPYYYELLINVLAKEAETKTILLPSFLRNNALINLSKENFDKLLTLTSKFPQLTPLLSSPDINRLDLDYLTTTFEAINKLNSQCLVHICSMILHEHDPDFILLTKLLDLWHNDPDLAYRLFEMAHTNLFSLVKYLLDFHEKFPNAIMTQKLLSLAGSKHAKLIEKILFFKLIDNLEDRDLKLYFETIFDTSKPNTVSLFLALLDLREQQNTKLLRQILDTTSRSKYDDRDSTTVAFISATQMMVVNGYYELAETAFKKEQGSIFHQYPFLTSQKVAQNIVDLEQDLHLSKLQKEESEQVKTLVSQIINSGMSEPFLCDWLGNIQFMIQHGKPEELTELLNEAEIAFKNGQTLPTKEAKEENIANLYNLWNQKTRISLHNLLLSKYASIYEGQSLDLNKLTQTIAKLLITTSGRINTNIIDSIKKGLETNFLLPENSSLKMHIEKVLDTLKNDHHYSERIKHLFPPKINTLQSNIIKEALGLDVDDPVSVQDVRIVALSALLYPTRQGSVGSCFATSIVCQLSSYQNGLKQIFEDYLSLLSKGKLRRIDNVKNALLEFPICYDQKKFSGFFAKENLLARIHEYTIASMSSSATNIYTNVSTHWASQFYNQMKTHLDTLTKLIKQEKDLLLEEFHSTFIREASDSTYVVYRADILDPVGGSRGGWVLADKNSDTFLDEESHFIEFLNKIFNLIEKEMLSNFGPYAKFIDEVFDDLKNRFLYNPKNLKKLIPEPQFVGGNVQISLRSYYNQPISLIRLPHAQNALESLSIYLSTLTPMEIEMNQKNPDFLSSISYPGHAFNLKLSVTFYLLDDKRRASIQESMRTNIEAIGKKAISLKEAEDFISRYLEYQPESHRKEYHNYLMIWIRQPRILNLETLTREILKIDPMFTGKRNPKRVKMIFDVIIRSLPDLGPKPAILPFADTNWLEIPIMGFTCLLPEYTIEEVYVNADDKVVYNDPYDFTNSSEYEIYRYHPITDQSITYHVA